LADGFCCFRFWPGNLLNWLGRACFLGCLLNWLSAAFFAVGPALVVGVNLGLDGAEQGV